MYNKHLGRIAMRQAKNLDGIAHEKYRSRKSKAAYIQALNIRIFYDIIRQKIIQATSVFADLVSNYDLVAHSIASLYLKRVETPKEPILYTFTTLQNMTFSVRTAFGDSETTYKGYTWSVPLKPPSQGLVQGNGAAPTIWFIVIIWLLNCLRESGHGASFK